jgi:hypothetical protein
MDQISVTISVDICFDHGALVCSCDDARAVALTALS